MAEAKNLVEGLTDEILRVAAIRTEYLQVPNNAGLLAAIMMEQAINKAREAQGSGEVLQMILALKELQEFEY